MLKFDSAKIKKDEIEALVKDHFAKTLKSSINEKIDKNDKLKMDRVSDESKGFFQKHWWVFVFMAFAMVAIPIAVYCLCCRTAEDDLEV